MIIKAPIVDFAALSRCRSVHLQVPEAARRNHASSSTKWEFPKMRGALLWGPSNKDPTIQGTVARSPIVGNSQIAV